METTQSNEHEENNSGGGSIIREKIDDNDSVAPFLIKLYSMVDDKETNSIISWGSLCTSFIILDKQIFTSKILPWYFKDHHFDSFIFQLNYYGFNKKKNCNGLEFEHEHFQEGKLHRIKTIKWKNSNFTLKELKIAFERVRQTQTQISNKIKRFKYDLEKSLSYIHTTTKITINNFLTTFTKMNGRKRIFLDIDRMIDFGDIEKHFKSIGDKFVVPGSEVDFLLTLSNLKEKEITQHGANRGEGGSDGADNGFRVPQFLHKLYTMVEKEEINDLISWKLPYRDSFIIWDINKFATHVLAMYFKHTNFASFNSQLNIYCFKKVSWEKHEYANEWFRGGRYDLLANIKRRSKNLALMRSTISCSTSELEMFITRLKSIQQDQENKISWLSKYEEQVKSSMCEFKKTIKTMDNILDKMIEKSNEKLENFKKAKLDVEGHGEEQESQVNEPVEKEKASREAQFNNEEFEIDSDDLERLLLDNPWAEFEISQLHGFDD